MAVTRIFFTELVKGGGGGVGVSKTVQQEMGGGTEVVLAVE